jgi:hypothetical protein
MDLILGKTIESLHMTIYAQCYFEAANSVLRIYMSLLVILHVYFEIRNWAVYFVFGWLSL